MAKVYSNGVTLPTGFKREFPAPGFDDEIWEFVDDLDTIPNQFDGMEVFIVQDQRKWLKKAIGWVPSSQEVDTSIFRRKLEKATVNLELDNSSTKLEVMAQATYLFVASGTIEVVNYLELTENDASNYDGREYTFINKQSTPIALTNLFASVNPLYLKFEFNDEEDYYLQPNEVLKCKWLAFLQRLVFVSTSSESSFRNDYKISVSQTTNIVQIPFKERISITDLLAITNIDSFSNFIVFKSDTALTERTTFAAINADIASLSSGEVAAGYTVQFKANLVAGQSNGSAILKCVKG